MSLPFRRTLILSLLMLANCKPSDPVKVPIFEDYCNEEGRQIPFEDRRKKAVSLLIDERETVQQRYGPQALKLFYRWIDDQKSKNVHELAGRLADTSWDCCKLKAPTYKRERWFKHSRQDPSEMLSTNGLSEGRWIYDIEASDFPENPSKLKVILVVGQCNTVRLLGRP